MYKYIWLLLFIAAGLFTLREEFHRKDYAEFDGTVFRFYYFTCFVLATALVWTWFKFYRIKKKALAILPITLPPLFLVLVLLITKQKDKKQQVPVFLVAGFETMQVQFRIDSTYRIIISGEFSGESYYGKFNLSGDTIILDRGHEVLYLSEKLLISKAETNDSNNTDTFIFPLDNHGAFINRLHTLPVRVDKRNLQ